MANLIINNAKESKMKQLKRTAEDAVYEEVKETEVTLESLLDKLREERNKLSTSVNEPENVKKAIEINIRKVEKSLRDFLLNEKSPSLKVEIWSVNEENENENETSFTKTKKEVIIATSVYNMETTKVASEMGMKYLNDERLLKDPIYLVSAKLFYDESIELKDQNNHTIPVNTPNVYVPLDLTGSYWKWQAYKIGKFESIIKGSEFNAVPNVHIIEFDSIKDYAQCAGINNMLSRGMNSKEKFGVSSLATQNEFMDRVFKEAVKRNLRNVSTIMKYFYNGKLMKNKDILNAMTGTMPKEFKYDLSFGDRILKLMDEKAFSAKVIKERYFVDAFYQCANDKDPNTKEVIGFEAALNALASLSSVDVVYINNLTEDHNFKIRALLSGKYKDFELKILTAGC